MYFNPILTKPTFPNALTSGHIACNRDHCWTNLRRKSLGKNGTSIFYCPSAISKKVSSCQNKTRTGEVLYHSASTTALAFNWPWRSCCYGPRQCASSRSWTWACPSELQETDLHQRASSTESCPGESFQARLENELQKHTLEFYALFDFLMGTIAFFRLAWISNFWRYSNHSYILRKFGHRLTLLTKPSQILTFQWH